MIFLDTNVVAEATRAKPHLKVMNWLIANDAELALSTVVIAEIAYGIERVRPDQRALRLDQALDALRERFAGRIYGFDVESALLYGRIMGRAKLKGRMMEVPDGMIAAIALRHGAVLATRNAGHFLIDGLTHINPWS